MRSVNTFMNHTAGAPSTTAWSNVAVTDSIRDGRWPSIRSTRDEAAVDTDAAVIYFRACARRN